MNLQSALSMKLALIILLSTLHCAHAYLAYKESLNGHEVWRVVFTLGEKVVGQDCGYTNAVTSQRLFEEIRNISPSEIKSKCESLYGFQGRYDYGRFLSFEENILAHTLTPPHVSLRKLEAAFIDHALSGTKFDCALVQKGKRSGLFKTCAKVIADQTWVKENLLDALSPQNHIFANQSYIFQQLFRFTDKKLFTDGVSVFRLGEPTNEFSLFQGCGKGWLTFGVTDLASIEDVPGFFKWLEQALPSQYGGTVNILVAGKIRLAGQYSTEESYFSHLLYQAQVNTGLQNWLTVNTAQIAISYIENNFIKDEAYKTSSGTDRNFDGPKYPPICFRPDMPVSHVYWKGISAAHTRSMLFENLPSENNRSFTNSRAGISSHSFLHLVRSLNLAPNELPTMLLFQSVDPNSKSTLDIIDAISKYFNLLSLSDTRNREEAKKRITERFSDRRFSDRNEYTSRPVAAGGGWTYYKDASQVSYPTEFNGVTYNTHADFMARYPNAKWDSVNGGIIESSLTYGKSTKKKK